MGEKINLGMSLVPREMIDYFSVVKFVGHQSAFNGNVAAAQHGFPPSNKYYSYGLTSTSSSIYSDEIESVRYI